MSRTIKSTPAIALKLCAVLFALCMSAEAQQPKKIPRVGVLWPFLPTVGPPFAEAFRQGLHNLGYVEDRNISIEYRYSEGNDAHLPDLAGELLHLKVDVIFAPTTSAALAAKNVTSEIPIITAAAADPGRFRARQQPGAARRQRHRAEFVGRP